REDTGVGDRGGGGHLDRERRRTADGDAGGERADQRESAGQGEGAEGQGGTARGRDGEGPLRRRTARGDGAEGEWRGATGGDDGAPLSDAGGARAAGGHLEGVAGHLDAVELDAHVPDPQVEIARQRAADIPAPSPRQGGVEGVIERGVVRAVRLV